MAWVEVFIGIKDQGLGLRAWKLGGPCRSLRAEPSTPNPLGLGLGVRV